MYYFTVIMSNIYFFVTETVKVNTYVAIVFLALLSITGCGKKNFEDSILKHSSSEKNLRDKTRTLYLPQDDGKPLTEMEIKALNSQGVIDRNISYHDLHDTVLHFKKYVRYERKTIEVSIKRGQKYLPYIFEEFRKEGIPEELAYIAFIESGFNPKAQSHAGAYGIWQFTYSTGKYFGMSRNRWVDKRCDPYISTRAAIQYFKKLYKLFKDWHLVITAYNAGEGKVSRALAATNTKTFFELRRHNDKIKGKDRLLCEQKQYLPKFIAICKIVRNLELLGFAPCDLSEADKMVEVKVKPGTNLKKLASCVGISWEDFFAHNAAYLKNVTPPGVHSIIYVPHHKLKQTHAVLKTKKSLEKTVAGKQVGMPKGGLNDLIAANKIGSSNSIKIIESVKDNKKDFSKKEKHPITQRLADAAQKQFSTIKNSNTQNQEQHVHHTVEKGDTLYSIARRYNVSQDLIIVANGLLGSAINAGQKLHIPYKEVVQKKETTIDTLQDRVDKTKKIVKYQVQHGDSLWSIARKFKIPPLELLALNNLTKEDIIQPGDYVKVHRN